MVANSANSPGEREVLDAVVALLERLHGATAGRREVPDAKNRTTRDVDLVVEIGGDPIALEHTSLDYSPDARKVSAFWRLVHPHVLRLRDCLLAELPGGEFTITFWGTPEGQERDVPGFMDAVSSWVLRTAPRLPPARTGQIRMERVESGRMSGTVRLCRYAPEWLVSEPPTVDVFAFDTRPGGLSAEPMPDAASKAMTLRRAFADKVPDKLDRYRRRSHRTVLVVQDVCRDAMPLDTLHHATHLLQHDYAGSLDMVVIVNTRDLPWSLQHADAQSVNDRELRKENWWLWVPEDHLLVQNDWELGPRRSIQQADPAVFERLVRQERPDDEPWGGQWSRLA